MFQDILYSSEDGIGTITLNKPDKLNALSQFTWGEIESALTAADADDAVKVIVITGAGRGFSAGTDLTHRADGAVPQRPFSERHSRTRSPFLVMAQIHHCRKPTIAAVNGVSVGAGFSLALACDFRIASTSARFSSIFVKRALVADTGTSWWLPRIVGMQRALELMFSGRIIGADEASSLGLVLDVVPPEQLESRTKELATMIAKGPSVAIELTKQLAYGGMQRSLEDQILQEQLFLQFVSQTEDAAEGRRSFLEKREPVFKGS